MNGAPSLSAQVMEEQGLMKGGTTPAPSPHDPYAVPAATYQNEQYNTEAMIIKE
eukprot:CAMPEP_0201523414 /NCGR_PEP_ID=MMETSP0161_2-20130828/19737_1 /ASSEMBLY_ACC=CAM_ASM_000251 /TAXON_ID=180227 /ORGANISM="Neoparamoeba aestuarina, Strain SoJaBio B1-5/56/2" /LENGTH=53 /DNA_ID=CAMNT_0047922529 /DNA_START=556 /DNA_END=717 /DNA_ORIENTATION=-